MAYAFVDDIQYRKWGALYVGDALLEHVPRLAICINLREDMEPLLFHCDGEWNVLGASGAETVEAVKARAEKNYPGVCSRWVDLNTSQDDALRYYDTTYGGVKCSFCGKRAFELEGWIEGHDATICTACVTKYDKAIRVPNPTSDRG